MLYKFGTKVVIVSKRADGMNRHGYMDKYLGTVMQIKGSSIGSDYMMKEDCGNWRWFDNMIDHEATGKLNATIPKSLLKDSFKVKFENHHFYWYLSKLNKAFSNIGGGYIDLNNYDGNLKQNCQVSNRLLGWDIMEIYNTEDVLIWEREKSLAQIEKEEIEKELEEISKKSAELKDRIKNLKV